MLTTLVMVAALQSAAVPEDVLKHYEELEYSLNDKVYKYRLMKPAKIEEGKVYPVILFLHGAGERGDDNVSQLKYLPQIMAGEENRQKYPCFVIAPQCPKDKKWSSAPWSDKDSTATPQEPTDELKAALAMLALTMNTQQVDVSRIYLTGLSMGGYGSWELAIRAPNVFAAVAPICGGGDERLAGRLKDVPLNVWHGDADMAVPVERSRRMVEAVKKAGGNPIYMELPGVGHDSWTPAYTREDGVVPWMFKQKNPKVKATEKKQLQ